MRVIVLIILLLINMSAASKAEIYVSGQGAYIVPSTNNRAEFPISELEAKEIKNMLSSIQNKMHAVFNFPNFNMSVIPCGEENSYSEILDGSITICSETLYAAQYQNNQGLLFGIVLHEMGHSLLNLWGLPNFDNERTADEFATVFLLMAHQEGILNGWVAFFDKGTDPYLETRGLLLQGGQHPLSFQRVAAIKKIISNPIPVIKRWNKVLYPQMTDNMLNKIINSPDSIIGADIELAQETLNNRN